MALINESDKVKFVVIGCGHIGKRHATMALNNEESELVGLCDTRPKSELALEKFEGIPFFSSIEELLAAGIDFDVANICTPNGLHSDQAIAALDQKKHIVVEKPIGLSKAKCESVIYKALRNHQHVFAVMQNRYSPPSAWLKEIVENKIIGDTFMVQVNCYWNRDDRYYKAGGWKGTSDLDGGTLFTQFSHFIDIMYWLFGDIKNIQGRFGDFTHKNSTTFEDSGFVSFDFLDMFKTKFTLSNIYLNDGRINIKNVNKTEMKESSSKEETQNIKQLEVQKILGIIESQIPVKLKKIT